MREYGWDIKYIYDLTFEQIDLWSYLAQQRIADEAELLGVFVAKSVSAMFAG